MTHILVTNDDGVNSPGLLALKQALEPLGRVSVIAPDGNRSAIGRGITIHNPLHVEEVRLADGSPALATDGTPVDCVRFATLGLLGDRPDVIVSGINLGLNLGDDVTYSGTVAAALEGILLGWPAIAVSAQAVDQSADQWDGTAYDFRAVARFTARLVPVVSRATFPRRVRAERQRAGAPARAGRPGPASPAWAGASTTTSSSWSTPRAAGGGSRSTAPTRPTSARRAPTSPPSSGPRSRSPRCTSTSPTSTA